MKYKGWRQNEFNVQGYMHALVREGLRVPEQDAGAHIHSGNAFFEVCVVDVDDRVVGGGFVHTILALREPPNRGVGAGGEVDSLQDRGGLPRRADDRAGARLLREAEQRVTLARLRRQVPAEGGVEPVLDSRRAVPVAELDREGLRLGLDVEVILTSPCIFCMGNH